MFLSKKSTFPIKEGEKEGERERERESVEGGQETKAGNYEISIIKKRTNEIRTHSLLNSVNLFLHVIWFKNRYESS